jgi:predicted acetyltransferase
VHARSVREAAPVAPEIRPLTRDDAEAADALAAEAFGAPARALPEPWPHPGTCPWGAFVGHELAGVATVRAFRSWFGGDAVPTAGIAAVAVRPEHRGSGLLAPLFAALLADARERGAVVSTLFPTAPAIYRRLGYEIVGELADVEVPVAPLTRIPAPSGITLRRADPEDERDVAAHRATYERWARTQNGPLTREGALHRPLDGRDTVTLALDGAAVVGYAAWSRTDGDAAAATVAVHELIGLTAPATAALWRLFGGFASLAGAVRLRTSGADLTRLALAAAPWRPVRQWPYCLRLLDVAGAFRARGVAPLDVTLPFSVVGDSLDGTYRLTADGGTATCDPADDDGPVFTGRGLALAYAGVQSCANLRFAGLLTGPDTDDARWDALLGGRPFHIRNYF